MSFYANNQAHFDEMFSHVSIEEMVRRVQNRDKLLHGDDRPASWAAFYHDDLAQRLAGTTILELGAGTGLNSLSMAVLGAAKVVVIDIHDQTRRLVTGTAPRLGLSGKLEITSASLRRWNSRQVRSILWWAKVCCTISRTTLKTAICRRRLVC